MTCGRILPLALLALLAACGGQTGSTTSATGKSATIRSAGRSIARPPSNPVHASPPARPVAQLQAAPGLEGVIGADADQLLRLFGPARLDVREDDARKLQWSGVPCVLDAYLYPQPGQSRAVATWVDARRGDGRDVDRAACIAALRRAPAGR